jgi:hypothetical protein
LSGTSSQRLAAISVASSCILHIGHSGILQAIQYSLQAKLRLRLFSCSYRSFRDVQATISLFQAVHAHVATTKMLLLLVHLLLKLLVYFLDLVTDLGL